jgi:anthranilate phosphoribosyltransferase
MQDRGAESPAQLSAVKTQIRMKGKCPTKTRGSALGVRLAAEMEIAGAFKGGDLTKAINISAACACLASNSTSKD